MSYIWKRFSGLGELPPMMVDTCASRNDSRAPENQRMENEIRSKLIAIRQKIASNPRLPENLRSELDTVEMNLTNIQTRWTKAGGYCFYHYEIYRVISPQVAKLEQMVNEAVASLPAPIQVSQPGALPGVTAMPGMPSSVAPDGSVYSSPPVDNLGPALTVPQQSSNLSMILGSVVIFGLIGYGTYHFFIKK